MSQVPTFTPPATKPRRASAVADTVIAAAVDAARGAAEVVAGATDVGEYEGVQADGQRLATHFFSSTAAGYRGWRWAVTMARAPRAKSATVCEVSMLVGTDSITAPPWKPWSERLEPGDVGREDVLPYSADDDRLMQGFEATGEPDIDEVALFELGLGRVRVLSPQGRDEAANRWYTGDQGPVSVTARSKRSGEDTSPARCATCGFLMLMAGSVRSTFGVCANEWSPDDGRVVSLDHGCGAHSETDVGERTSEWADRPHVVDEHAVELFDHQGEREAAAAKRDSEAEGTAPDAADGEAADGESPTAGESGAESPAEGEAEGEAGADGATAEAGADGTDEPEAPESTPNEL